MKNTPLFSKGQRIAIVLLLFLIVAIWLADSLIARFATPPEAHHKEALLFQAELDSFSAKIKPINRTTNYQQKGTSTYVDWDAYPTQYQLHQFDPNKADSATLAGLGLSVRVVRNILRYREKGGYFTHAEKLGEIYGMQAEKFAELKPYIVIEPRPTSPKILAEKKSNKKDTVLELNSADTTELQYIRGIGSYYAKQIVRYRQQLGGYYKVEQLREIMELEDSAYTAIAKHFTVDTTQIQRIKVNMASVEHLKRHPYIDFYAARSIYETRRNAFQLNGISELSDKDGLPADVLEKLRPYLSFEQREMKKYNR